MNPFDLRGPPFLLFYFLLSCGVVALLWYIQKLCHERSTGHIEALEARIAGDPYLIACLRGCPRELIQVALVSLLERGLLKAKGSQLEAVVSAANKARRPLDKAILGLYKKPGKGSAAFDDTVVLSEAEQIREQLNGIILPAGDWTEKFRVFSGFTAIGFLWLVALTKIVIALGRGHHNVFFLCIMACLVLAPVIKVMGDNQKKRVLNRLRGRFDRLKSAVQLDGQTGKTAFYAAVFGLVSLPPEIDSIIKPLALSPSASSSYDSSYYSSFDTSSCGGGGGGSGCGGCG